MSLSISACLSICLSVYLSVFLSFHLPSCLCLSVCLSFFLSVCLPFYLSICLSFCLSSVNLSIGLSFCLSIFLPVYRSICLSVYLSACPSVCLSVYLPICLSAYLSIYRSLYLSIAPKQSNSARLPQQKEGHSSKTTKFCETSPIFKVTNSKNEVILRDFLRKWNAECGADGLVPMRFAMLPLHLFKALRLPQKSEARSYEALHLSRKITLANLKI